MPIKKSQLLIPILLVFCTWPSYGQKSATTLADALQLVDRDTKWQLVSEIDIAFDTHHPQGFALIGDYLFISSVEIIERTRRFEEPVNGLDRTPGKGVGHEPHSTHLNAQKPPFRRQSFHNRHKDDLLHLHRL